MASGDRIELLTTDTFSSTMSTVAKETSVQTINTNVNTANTNINSVKSTASTINTNVSTIQTSIGAASTAPSVTSAGGVVNTSNTIQQKLQGISQYQIGATNSTGGSATAGNVMAKLNALITSVNSIQASAGDASLHTTVFVPSDNLLKRIVSSPITTTTKGYYFGCFSSKYAGTVLIKINGRTTATMTYLYAVIDETTKFYPTMSAGVVDVTAFSSQNYAARIPFNSATSGMQSCYMPVQAGRIYYFAFYGTGVCNSLEIYGSTISYF